MDHGKINAELAVLRELMGLVNRQVGVYCDCLSGLVGNKVRIERLDAARATATPAGALWTDSLLSLG